MVICGLSMASIEQSRLHGSIAALKGLLTHTLDWCYKFLPDPEDKLMHDTIILFQEEITKRHKSLEEAIFSTSGISEEETEVQGQAIAIYEDWVTSSWSTLRKKLGSLNQAASKSFLNTFMTNTTASPKPAGTTQKQFNVRLLCQFLLMMEHLPADFCTW